jgi:hypothetical protein
VNSKIKEDDMGEACGTLGKVRNATGFGGES